MTPVFRFAPSPTGYLHLGHALSAAFVWRAAAEAGGRVLLRIEDIDPVRARPEFSLAIEDDLAWLGFEWSGPVRRQSGHLDDYARALDGLVARGLVYACRLSRSDIAVAAARAEKRLGAPWPRDPDGAPRVAIPGSAPGDADGPHALRLDMAAAVAASGPEPLTWRERDETGATHVVAARPQDWGDVVLARKDTPTSYHLAVTLDDASQGVTHVVRGADLYHATSAHRLLQRLLGLPEPLYRHHGLISGADGQKLAKSRGSTSLRDLRADGWTRADVFRALDGFLKTATDTKPSAQPVI